MPRSTPWTADDWREHREEARADEVARAYFRRPAGRAFAESAWSTSTGRFVFHAPEVDAVMRDATSVAEQRQRIKELRAAERQSSADLEAESREAAAEVKARREEQEDVLAAIDVSLPRSMFYRTQWDSAGHWDEYMCRAIREWAANFRAPDGSVEWEDALMEVAIANATTRVSQGLGPAMQQRRVGALHTLRWLVPELSFRERPGALDPDPRTSIEERAERGYCVCSIVPGDHPYISEGPFCKVHQMRRASFLPPLPARGYPEAPVFSDGVA